MNTTLQKLILENNGSREDILSDVSDYINSLSKTPHKCPVCGGRGIVPNGFYTAQYGMTSNTAPENCRSCINGLIFA